MDPKDPGGPRNRRPDVPREEKRVNLKRQSLKRSGAHEAGDEDAYSIDPRDEPAPAEEGVGSIADRARGERGLFDREDGDPDETLSRENTEESSTLDEPPASDEVEIRRTRT